MMYNLLTKIETYDPELKDHCMRTMRLATGTGSLLGLDEYPSFILQQAAMFHDLGKICIPPDILMKPGKLTPEERAAVDRHSLYGYHKLIQCGYPEDTALIVLLHHGDRGYGIPYSASVKFLADILRACDIFDAVTHDRPYHEHVSGKEGLRIVREQNNLPHEILDALSDYTAPDFAIA